MSTTCICAETSFFFQKRNDSCISFLIINSSTGAAHFVLLGYKIRNILHIYNSHCVLPNRCMYHTDGGMIQLEVIQSNQNECFQSDSLILFLINK